MNREEFSNMLVEARKKKEFTSNDVLFSARIPPTSIFMIERARSSYSTENVFKYLDAIGYVISVSKGNKVFLIKENNELIEWEKVARGDYSRMSFSSMIGCSKSYILFIESGRNIMSIDKFLKIAEITGYSISLVDKEE